jgi:predicted phosphate transport protein (TIGR00153 family)
VLRLFPREENFFDLFRKQAAIVHQGADLLVAMVRDYTDLEQKAKTLREVEHQGDQITHEIFERLNRTFVTPIEREDIHALASGLDDVLDSVEAIASRFVLLRIEKPTPECLALVDIIDKAAEEIVKAVDHLKDLRTLMSFTIEINRLENVADVISRDVVAALFDGKRDALDVLRWKEIYGRLEATADQCEDIANIIEAIVLKNS